MIPLKPTPIKETLPRVCHHCGRAIVPPDSYTDAFTIGRVWCHRPECIEASAEG